MATSGPKVSFIVSAILSAWEKSAWCKFKTILSFSRKVFSTSLSTVAPPGILPTVGVPWIVLEPSAPSIPRPPTTRLPWAIPYTSPSAPLSAVINKVPPFKDFAFPIVETVTSIVCPGFAKGGKFAVTITLAAFEASISAVFAMTPNCEIIAAILCLVKLTLPSPVLARPITKPYPTNWFDLTPATEAISLILSALTFKPTKENANKKIIFKKYFFIILKRWNISKISA